MDDRAVTPLLESLALARSPVIERAGHPSRLRKGIELTMRESRPPATSLKPETQIAPWNLKGGILEDPDIVVALLRYGTDQLHDLPSDMSTYTIGSADDRYIVMKNSFVSGHHCRLEREAERVQVIDERSTNGTHFEGRREGKFFLKPGECFSVGTVTHQFVALNSEMKQHYASLKEIVGTEEEYSKSSDMLSPADVIIRAVRQDHLIVFGESYSRQKELARIIHDISQYKKQSFIELTRDPIKIVSQAQLDDHRIAKCTILLDIDENGPVIEPAVVGTLFLPQNHARVIALAPSAESADKAIGVQYVRQMRALALRPVAQRARALELLLDSMFLRLNTRLRFADLTDENQDALKTYCWPENFRSLQETAYRLSEIERLRSINKAAMAMKVAPSTLYNWHKEIMKLSRPLTLSTDFED